MLALSLQGRRLILEFLIFIAFWEIGGVYCFLTLGCTTSIDSPVFNFFSIWVVIGFCIHEEYVFLPLFASLSFPQSWHNPRVYLGLCAIRGKIFKFFHLCVVILKWFMPYPIILCLVHCFSVLVYVSPLFEVRVLSDSLDVLLWEIGSRILWPAS